MARACVRPPCGRAGAREADPRREGGGGRARPHTRRRKEQRADGQLPVAVVPGGWQGPVPGRPRFEAEALWLDP